MEAAMAYEGDPLKTAAVRGFVNTNFPGLRYEVIETYNSDREAQMFSIRQDGRLSHIFGVSREFLDDHAVVEIERLLGDEVLQLIRERGPDRITMLTNDGIREVNR